MNDLDRRAIQGGGLEDVSDPVAYTLIVDAGVAHLRIRGVDSAGKALDDTLTASNCDFSKVLCQRHVQRLLSGGAATRILITGKLAAVVHRALGRGTILLPAAVLWLAANDAVRETSCASLALVEISASGYTLLGVDKDGRLKDDFLVVNPRCGAGSGINVDRVLQKLGLGREQVDVLLADYLGDAGRDLRRSVITRADRCGVFSSSATISDKNQGIPLPIALAITLKSELLKTLKRLPAGVFERVILSGRFFRWQFVRDCADDYSREIGIQCIEYDTENTRALDTIARLAAKTGVDRLAEADARLLNETSLDTYPGFAPLHADYLAEQRYCRQADDVPETANIQAIARAPVHVGLDVGSTMAKIVIADDAGIPLYYGARSNAGDTIETVKNILGGLRSAGIARLSVRSIGITGSARYQVKEALTHIYPALVERIHVVVENYAHARGSIIEARQHLAELKRNGIHDLNEHFCILVDVGGEDTKISTVALREAELFNNAMNIKCSAGTGSLLDTLAALFGLSGPGEASVLAYGAPRAWAINATCAVFLVENAQKLQAQGVPRAEILASASWAVVENMARTLWSQVDLPGNCVVLLHGQTMLSDPLPLAITHRLQSFLRGPAYALVPSHPGHRACLGLIRTATQGDRRGADTVALEEFIAARFEKRVVQCKGAACDDPHAVCNRTSLKCRGADGRQFGFTLGGCSAINELFARSKGRQPAAPTRGVRDSYKELWAFVDAHQPRSDDPRRLVIPRCFAVSEWSYFLSQIFAELGVPVHVDTLRDADLTRGQPLFNIDTCAPHIGTVGHFQRIASEPHGIVLAPQIEYICTEGKSLGRTCTMNQGGIAVAKNLAEMHHPDARFHLFAVSLERLDAGFVADQLFDRLQPVFRHYDVAIDRKGLEAVIAHAFDRHRALRGGTADLAADLIEHALAEQRAVALVVGREYVLNPGIYDSHVRRLLRDKEMMAIPSYVLDVELDDAYRDVYWRNPHFILTLLSAVADKRLHTRLRHPRLRELFRRLEEADALLPVVQISTFSCGPDSVTAHLVAEIMKRRPFLLIQSDAVIKELAHLENRVNTYVRQLELGLHDRLSLGGRERFDVRILHQLDNRQALNRETDVIYCPTISDNRPVTSVLRAAGFTCVDNYQDGDDLRSRIKQGRRLTGDAVCAPLAAVYADLQRAVEDFARRRTSDPQFLGKRRLLFIDNTGNGPCRQGRYVGVHKLLAHRYLREARGGDALVSFLVADEAQGYNFGLEEWTVLRIYQAAIVQGVLHQLLFAAAAECGDIVEYEHLLDDYRRLKGEMFQALESFRGPGLFMRRIVDCTQSARIGGALAKYLAYRLHGRDLQAPLRRFAARWQTGTPAARRLSIQVSGEVYMRVAQGEAIFRSLLAQLGFRRFRMQVTPLWSYLEYLIEHAMEVSRQELEVSLARAARLDGREDLGATRQRRQLRRLRALLWVLRNVLARPLYRAARIPMPEPVAHLMCLARTVVPTIRPVGEFPPLVGEALSSLGKGLDAFLIVAPRGCMVCSIGVAMSPRLGDVLPGARGRIQHLFSADGEVDEDMLRVAMLRSLGPSDFLLRPEIDTRVEH